MLPKITVHALIKNEENFIWYALTAVLPYVDKLIVFDTGSEDKTVEIVKGIKTNKIFFEEKGKVDVQKITVLRNEMIEKTETDWFMLLDGDEIWPKDSFLALLETIKSASEEKIGAVVRNYVCVGDIYHLLKEEYGQYQLLGKKGHLNIRAYRKRGGYKWKGLYPLEAYVDIKDQPINKKDDNLLFLDKYYWHFSFVPRSSKDTHGRKNFILGEKISQEKFPEVFYLSPPLSVPYLWQKMSFMEVFLRFIFTKLRNLWKTK